MGGLMMKTASDDEGNDDKETAVVKMKMNQYHYLHQVDQL
jgi:hypothetical protein